MRAEQDGVSGETAVASAPDEHPRSQAENPPDELTKRLAELVADQHCK